MHLRRLGFALDLSNIDLLDRDLLDTDLDKLETEVDFFPVNILRLEDDPKAYLEEVLKKCLEYWRGLHRNNFLYFKIPWRCLQDILKPYSQHFLKMTWKTKSCYAEDVFKTSSRHVLKTYSRCLGDQQVFAR